MQVNGDGVGMVRSLVVICVWGCHRLGPGQRHDAADVVSSDVVPKKDIPHVLHR